MTSGSDSTREYLGETGSTRTFCSRCGTTFLFHGPRWEGEVHVVVGTLDDGHGLEPNAHAYADRSPDWYPITDDLRRYGGPDGNAPL